MDDDVPLTGAVLGGFAGVGAQRLAAELHATDGGGVADRTVDDHTGPPVLHTELGDHVTHQSSVDRGVTVDDEDATRVVLLQGLLDQAVVLEAADGGDRTTEVGVSAEVAELGVAAAGVRPDDVDEVGGGDEGDVSHVTSL